MNWYTRIKLASVTFDIVDTEKISQPMTVSDICNDILNFGYYTLGLLNEQKRLSHNDISPDGDDYFEWTGTINFYMPVEQQVETTDAEGSQQWSRVPVPAEERVTRADILALIKAYVEHKAGSIEIVPDRVDESQMRGLRVLRANVTKNETQEYGKIPTLNVANSNAKQLLQLLASVGVSIDPSEWSGTFSADEYRRARPLISQQLMQNFSRPSSEGAGLLEDVLQEGMEREVPERTPYEQQELEEEQGTVNSYNFGLPVEQIQEYLARLDEMVNWLDEAGVQSGQITFG